MANRRKSFRNTNWASRNESFQADDETTSTLRDLGYSETEIGATAGQLPSEMESEEKLRLSLRALSEETSRRRQVQAEASAPPFNPKLEKTEQPPQDEEEAYRRGRRDERYLRKNDPEYVPPTKEPKPPRQRQPRAPRQRQPRPVNFARLYRKAGGKWR